MPGFSLALWIRELGLQPHLVRQRQGRDGALDLESIKEAIRRHGSGAAAARALGVARDAVVWRLRKAGLTVEGVLASA